VPVVEGFNVLSREYLTDPVAYFAEVRKKARIFFAPELQAWILTRYRDIEVVLREDETFSSATAQIPPLSTALRKLVPEEDERIVRQLFANQLIFSDQPVHTIERRTARLTFSRKRIETTRARIEEICTELIDEFAGRGAGNLMEMFARRFTLRVVGTMLGLNVEDLDRFQGMVMHFFSLMAPSTADAAYLGIPDEQVAASFAGLMEGYRYFAKFIDERRESPRDDMATAMISLRDDHGNSVMSTEDVLAHMIGIVAAGTDTASNLIGSIVYRLTLEPGVRDAAIADPSLWPAVVEEALRRESPGDKALRTVTRDTEIAGQHLPKGSAVLVLMPAANGDPEVFPDPLKFDYQRPEIGSSRHFGIGRHFCLGAPIVLPEACIAMEQLYSRLPGLKADIGAGTEFAPTLMRIRTSLPVIWNVPKTM
jgi:cytochrome P450